MSLVNTINLSFQMTKTLTDMEVCGIKIILFTHDQSGVTKKDIDFARDLEKIY